MRRLALLPAVLLALAACGSSGDEPATTDPAPADSTAPAATTPDTAPDTAPADSTPATVVDVEVAPPTDVRPERVLLAAAILASGDIDDAVAKGLVTPAEVDEAVAAIEAGDLGRWEELAAEQP